METIFLVNKSSPLFFPPRPLSSAAAAAAAARPFEEALAARLRSLLPAPAPTISLAWLARAVRVLSLTLSDAAALLSTADASPDLSAHLDSGVALLDAVNLTAAEIDRLLLRRLPLLLALTYLSPSPSDDDPSSDRLARAGDVIAEWQFDRSPAFRHDDEDAAAALVHALRAVKPPGVGKGKCSVVRRVIYAVEAVSGLVLGTVIAVLRGGGREFAGVHVSGEFPWASEYEKVLASVSGKLGGGPAAEVEAVESAVKNLTEVMDASREKMKLAAEETWEITAMLTDALEGLSSDVNSLFRTLMSERNMVLEKFRG